ncbi:MAG: transglycosylase domain-containing protein, partial [Hyphomicrobium sp.]
MSDRATTTTDETAEAAVVPSPPIARQRSRWRTAAVALCAVALAAVGGGYATYRTAVAGMPALSTIEAEQLSTVVVDRDGRLLRPFTNAEGRWRLPVEPKDVDQRYLMMLLAFEDQRFYRHGGVDVPAVLRAAAQGLVYGRLVSGASTLTMQTARLLDQRHERTGLGKIRQMSRALELEQRYSKTDILRFYLRLAPFGGNIEGV